MAEYVSVMDEDGTESIELPTEEDNMLLLTTLSAQFPGASGLKYRTETNAMRGIRLVDGNLCPPPEGWSSNTYIIVYPKEKRKGDFLENPLAKTKKLDKLKCTDLIVLGLPWKTTEDELKTYFMQFGEVQMVQLKYDYMTKQSKGYGFVRFADYETQVTVLSQRHTIDGRICSVRIPNSKEGNMADMSPKIYVGRTTDEMTVEDLREYFSQYGTVQDVFIPKPFRGFAFVTFSDPWVAQALHGDDHVIKNVSVHIASATPKSANSADSFEKQWFMKSGQNDAYQHERNSAQMAAAMAAAQAVFSQSFLGIMSTTQSQNGSNTHTYAKAGQPGSYANTMSKPEPTYGPYGSINNGASWNR